MTIEHQPADQGRLARGRRSSWPVTAKPRAATQAMQQQPGRHQHDRAVVAVGGEMHDEHEADAGDRRDGHRARRPPATGGSMTASPISAARKTSQNEGHVAVADMPAVEVEIGEQEDQKGRGEHRLGAGALYLLADSVMGKMRWKKPKSMQI